MNSLLIGGAFLLSVFNPAPPVVYAEQPPPTLQEQGQQIAEEYGVPWDLMNKIITAESSWRPDAVGDRGRAFGLAQIHLDYHASTTKEQALDPIYALKFVAQEIKDGKEWQHTICSCTAEVRRLGARVPFKDRLIPNTEYPRVGGVIIFQEKELRHLAYIDSVQEDGIHIKEANYVRCSRTQRVISPSDKKIIGYWHEIE